jgi:hypothetical protein
MIMTAILTATDERGSGRIHTRTYEVSLPTGTTTATIPQGYRAAEGGGEIARLRLMFPTLVNVAIIA